MGAGARAADNCAIMASAACTGVCLLSAKHSGSLPPAHGDLTESFLQHFPHAVLLVDSKGAVTGLNQRAAAIVAQGDGLFVCQDVLRCARPADTAALHRLIGDAAQCDGRRGAAARYGLRLRRSGRRPLSVLMTPFRCQSVVANGAVVIGVFVHDPECPPAIDVQVLRDWYGLTPAETRVAVLLAGGLSLKEIVERFGIGANTARTHLKSIFAKTETRRQGELIQLLLSHPVFGPGPVTGLETRLGSRAPTLRVG